MFLSIIVFTVYKTMYWKYNNQDVMDIAYIHTEQTKYDSIELTFCGEKYKPEKTNSFLWETELVFIKKLFPCEMKITARSNDTENKFSGNFNNDIHRAVQNGITLHFYLLEDGTIEERPE